MWPLIAIAIVGMLLYNHAIALHTTPGSTPGLPPPPVVTSMQAGQQYGFTIASPLNAEAIVSELAGVGANVVGVLVPVGPSLWDGVFVWAGANGEPTENLPQVTWVSLQPMTSFAGVGQSQAHHTHHAMSVGGVLPGGGLLYPIDNGAGMNQYTGPNGTWDPIANARRAKAYLESGGGHSPYDSGQPPYGWRGGSDGGSYGGGG